MTLIRTKGKTNTSVLKKHFYPYYVKNHTSKKVDIKTWTSFTRDVFKILSEAMIEQNLEIKLANIGKFRIRTIPSKILRSDGSFTNRKINWNECWKYWHEKYPNLTKGEIVKIKGKFVIYHENEHSHGERYIFNWDYFTMHTKFLKFYDFKPSRTMARLLAKTVKDPNRKVFYYE